MMKGKLELTDKSKTTWAATDDVRIGFEFGTQSKFRDVREKVRFCKVVSAANFKPAETEEGFDTVDKERFYGFLKLESDSKSLDKSNKNGFIITKGSTDKVTRTATVEFTRPVDVAYSKSLTIDVGKTYKIWLVWGIFDNALDKRASRAKGMRLVNDGVDWAIPVPPNFKLNAMSMAVSAMTLISTVSLII